MLDARTGLLRPDPIDLTPDQSFDGTAALTSFINANEAAILTETHDVPAQLAGMPFLGGAVFNFLSGWNAPGVSNPEARHKFSLNTCNGCHSSAETNTFFLMVNPRSPGEQSFLSGFLTGTVAFDPVTGQPHAFNDLRRRQRDLHLIVCPNDPPPPPVENPDGGVGPRPRPGRDGGVTMGTGGAGGTPGSGSAGGSSGGGAADAGAAPPPPPPPPPSGPSTAPTTSLTQGIKRVH